MAVYDMSRYMRFRRVLLHTKGVLLALLNPQLIYLDLIQAVTQDTFGLKGSHETPLALAHYCVWINIPWLQLAIL